MTINIRERFGINVLWMRPDGNSFARFLKAQAAFKWNRSGVERRHRLSGKKKAEHFRVLAMSPLFHQLDFVHPRIAVNSGLVAIGLPAVGTNNNLCPD
jgi:hypothetical protein